MTPLLQTNYLDTRGYDWDLSHLYEHCFITSFYNFVQDKGFYPQHIGWINANNFEEVTFFEAGFYDPEVQKLFKEFMENTPEFSDEVIAGELNVMNAEGFGYHKITDHDELKRQFGELSARNFDRLYSKVKRQKVITFSKKPRDFIKISTRITLRSNDDSLKRLFSRAFIFFLDEVYYKIRSEYSIFGLANSFIPRIRRRGDKNMFFIDVAYINKKFWNEKEINNLANNTAQQIDFVKIKSAVRKHMVALTNYPAWQSHMTDRYRHTGMIVENREIGKLCTIDNLKLIQKNLQIEVYKARPSEDGWIEY